MFTSHETNQEDCEIQGGEKRKPNLKPDEGKPAKTRRKFIQVPRKSKEDNANQEQTQTKNDMEEDMKTSGTNQNQNQNLEEANPNMSTSQQEPNENHPSEEVPTDKHNDNRQNILNHSLHSTLPQSNLDNSGVIIMQSSNNVCGCPESQEEMEGFWGIRRVAVGRQCLV